MICLDAHMGTQQFHLLDQHLSLMPCTHGYGLTLHEAMSHGGAFVEVAAAAQCLLHLYNIKKCLVPVRMSKRIVS